MTSLLFGLAVLLAVVVLFSKSKKPLATDVLKMLSGHAILRGEESVLLVATLPREMAPNFVHRLHAERSPGFFALTTNALLLLSLKAKDLQVVQRTPFSELTSLQVQSVEGRVCIDLKIRVEQTIWLTPGFCTSQGECNVSEASHLISETILASRPELKRA